MPRFTKLEREALADACTNILAGEASLAWLVGDPASASDRSRQAAHADYIAALSRLTHTPRQPTMTTAPAAAPNPTPIREALASARAMLNGAERKRSLAFDVLAQMVREHVARPLVAGRTAMLESALGALDHWTTEAAQYRKLVDELVRDAAIAAETAHPDGPSSEQRARVEALIYARVFGLSVVEVGEGPRRWFGRIEGGRRFTIPHYTSDPVACRDAEATVDGLRLADVLINDVLALDADAVRVEAALAVLRATPFERALAVLGAAGVNPADDPCAEG